MESMILDTLELDGIELLMVDNHEELSMGHGVTEIGASVRGEPGTGSILV
jgi:hypothetical protein